MNRHVPSTGVGAIRWSTVAWVFAVAAISYLDRNNLSIAIAPIQEKFGLTDIEIGTIFSAFVFGYAFVQPWAGHLADRFGPHKLIACSLALWSALTIAFTLVPAGLPWSFLLLLLVRVLLGIGEAVIFPAGNRMIANWIPMQERGLANGIIFAGVGVGGAVAPPLITSFMLAGYWEGSFYACAALGIMALVLWLILVRESPADDPRVSETELAHIMGGMPNPVAPSENRNWRSFVMDRQIRVLTASYFCYGYVAYIFFTWFFKYLSEIRHLDLKASAIYAMLPFIAMTVASPLGGYISDQMLPRFGYRVARCGFAGVSMVVASGFVGLATQVTDARFAAAILAGGAGSLYLAQSVYWTLSADIGGKSAGTLSGIMNMGCQVGGVVTASLTPIVAKDFGWTGSFILASLVGALGGMLWLAVAPGREKHIRALSVR